MSVSVAHKTLHCSFYRLICHVINVLPVVYCWQSVFVVWSFSRLSLGYRRIFSTCSRFILELQWS